MIVKRGGEKRTLAADLVVMSGGSAGNTAFLSQAGGSLRYDRDQQRYVPDRVPDGIRVVGAAAGAARARGAVPSESGSSCKQVVCFCEDVTTKDISLSLEEGFRSLELSKRYTTVTMGPCQGRMCHRNSGLVIADELGARCRRPAGRRDHCPAAPQPDQLLAPCRARLRAGEAHRRPTTGTPSTAARCSGPATGSGPYDYGGADGEAAAVHESLGLIDVSTLGKLIVRGPDAAAFLERIYPNRFGDMKLARVRYGIVCGDDGSILDDGTVARLSETEYYVTTTSSRRRRRWSSGSSGGTRSGRWTARSST